jgi:hypothetical protein
MSSRFAVTYIRTFLRHFGSEQFARTVYAPSYKAAVRAVQGLPRFLDLVSCVEIAAETPAEAAARVARENAAPVPYGC